MNNYTAFLTLIGHINAYLPDAEVTEVPEEFIRDLVNFDVRSK